jgi:uncharacterized membrane protein YfcA
VTAPLVSATTPAREAPDAARTHRWLAVVSIAAATVAVVAIALAPAGERGFLTVATLFAAAAGLSATSIGVFGGVLVPGLLLLGVDPRVAAPVSLFLQVLVIPIGATSHHAMGHVKRRITVPLVIGGVLGSVSGALLATSVPKEVVTQGVAVVIIIVGVIVLASLRTGYASGLVDHEEVHQGRIAGIGVVSGFASGISGAGWGPIGVKLLILSRIDPRHAIGSSLVGRIFMAAAAIATYAATAMAFGSVEIQPYLIVPLLGGAIAAMVPGTAIIARMGRDRAAAAIAILSICLAIPLLVGG